MKIELIEIKKLKPHEKTNLAHLEKLKKRVLIDGKIRNPIIIDRNSLTILDGHHRVETVRLLGLNKIPAYLVNYNDSKIKVFPFRKNIRVSKRAVLAHAKHDNKFPPKTTRHVIPKRPLGCNTPLEFLI
jgi:ParB-like chromosome segregation protein Spo0J